MPDNFGRKPAPIVWWVLWIAFMAGLPQFYIFLSPKTPPPSPPPFVFAVLTLIPFFISVAIRWIVLPRFKMAQAAMPIFIMGIAFAESLCFFGLFLMPAYKDVLFGLSFLGIMQFAPYYASKYQ